MYNYFYRVTKSVKDNKVIYRKEEREKWESKLYVTEITLEKSDNNYIITYTNSNYEGKVSEFVCDENKELIRFYDAEADREYHSYEELGTSRRCITYIDGFCKTEYIGYNQYEFYIRWLDDLRWLLE